MLKIIEPVFVTSVWPLDMRTHSMPSDNPVPIFRSVPRPSFTGLLIRASGPLLCIINIAMDTVRMQPCRPGADYPSQRFILISNPEQGQFQPKCLF